MAELIKGTRHSQESRFVAQQIEPGEIRRQHFDGYCAIEERIVRLVDLAHAAGAELLHDAVASKRGTCWSTIPPRASP